MSTESTQVFDAALCLPPNERAGLAYKLLQSLKPPGILNDDDPLLASELERRATAYETGLTSASEWDTVAQRLRQALNDRTLS